MKSAELDLCILGALGEMGDCPENGRLIEIERRAVNYIVSDGRAVLAHRAELGDDSPENTLLGTFVLPASIYPAADDFRHAPGPVFATLTDEGDGRLMLGATPFVPLPESPRPWRRAVIPHAEASGEVAQLDLPRLSKLVMGAGRAARFNATAPFISHNGRGLILVLWEAAPNTFGVLAPAADIKESTLPSWARSPSPEAAMQVCSPDPMELQ